MLSRILQILCLSGVMISVTCQAGTTTLDADGGIRLDGKRWFPIGLYATPKSATEMAETAKIGFNMVRSGLSSTDLDLVHSHGLKAWIPVGGLSEVHDSTSAEKLKNTAVGLMNHPGLALWELPDEALWNVYYGRLLVHEDEVGEIRKRVLQKVEEGGDQTALKSLYRDLIAAKTIQDWARAETVIGDLWKALGEKDKPVATTLSQLMPEEEALYQRLLAGYRTLRSCDPGHLVWQNHAPRNSLDLLRKHADYCDLIGCDIYPYPANPSQGHSDLADHTLASVGAYTGRFRKIAPDKGVLMVLQGFGWRDLNPDPEKEKDPKIEQPPKYLASRFMAYDAIVCGAKGICYWGTNYPDEARTAWKGLVPVIQELASLQDFLAAPEIPLPLVIQSTPSWGSLDKGVICSVRKVNDDWVFIFVNESDATQTIQVEFPRAFVGKKLFFLYENLFIEPVAEGYFPFAFAPYGVRILSTRQDLEVEALKGLNRQFEEPF